MKIGVIGDYNPEFESHVATTEALGMAAAALQSSVSVEWLPTESIGDQALSEFDGLWASPGAPYRSMHGMLQGIRFARERLRPMIAT